MFLGFVQFGKQSKNSKTISKKQARKSNEQKHEHIINKPLDFHQFSWLFQAWKMHWFFYAFFMKNGIQNGAKIDAKIV